MAAECEAVKDAAGLLDISGFARYQISGQGAKAWLDHVLACKLPTAGRVRLAPMLAEDGRLKGDMTVFNWGDGTYWLMGSFYLRAFHIRWFNQHMTTDVCIEDISDATNGFLLTGPRTFEILKQVSDTDLSTLKMMRCSVADLKLHRCQIARLSLSGEVGVEISCAANEHASLRKVLLAAGADMGLKEIGFWSMLSMRLEKSIGIWNAEFTQSYTLAQTGLDRWIAWDKGDFIGRNSAKAAKVPQQLLVMLEIDADDADAVGFEPVWHNGKRVGMTTSGGYGHRTQRSFAMALVDRAHFEIDTELSVHVMGEVRPAKVIEMSPYDPSGARARS